MGRCKYVGKCVSIFVRIQITQLVLNKETSKKSLFWHFRSRDMSALIHRLGRFTSEENAESWKLGDQMTRDVF